MPRSAPSAPRFAWPPELATSWEKGQSANLKYLAVAAPQGSVGYQRNLTRSATLINLVHVGAAFASASRHSDSTVDRRARLSSVRSIADSSVLTRIGLVR